MELLLDLHQQIQLQIQQQLERIRFVYLEQVVEKLLHQDQLHTINVQNYFQLISSYKIPMQKEKTLTQILV